MNIAQLETDLAAVKTRASALIEKTTTACRDHVVKAATDTTAAITGRLMTAEERAAIELILGEGEDLQKQLDRAKSDATFTARLDKITGGRPVSTGGAFSTSAHTSRSLGQQWVESDGFRFFKSGQHHGGSAWRSPAIELAYDPTRSMWATTLTEDPASGGKLIVPQYLPGILQKLTRRLVVADLIAPGTTDSNSIVYMVETLFTNAAAPVAEGSAKPESALTFDQVSEAVSKIAHWLPVTEELLEDVAAIRSYIDARLTLGVQLAEEDQLLNGNGTPPNLRGLMNRSGLATSIARDTPALTPAETNADAIYRQITAIATTSYVYPDGIVMNPANWGPIVVSKDTTGNYLAAGPFNPQIPTTLWGLPVAPTPAMVAGTALVGAFSTAAQIFRRGGLRVEASNSHQDYFIKNLVAIRAEERLALAVYRPGAFGKVTNLN